MAEAGLTEPGTALLLSFTDPVHSQPPAELVPADAKLLVVTHDDSPELFIDEWATHTGYLPETIQIVSVGGPMRSSAAVTEPQPSSQNLIHGICDPGNLEAIARVVCDILDRWANDAQPVLYVDSLSAVFQHAGLHAGVACLTTIIDCVEAAKGVGYFHVRTSRRHHMVATVAFLFDTVLELTDDGVEPFTATSSSRSVPIEATDFALCRLSPDTVFDALRNSRRRQLLYRLFEAETPLSLTDLAEHIAAVETGLKTRTVSAEDRKRVQVSLFQIHVPRLEQADIVTVGDQRQTVTLTSTAAELLPYLGLAMTAEQ